MRLVDPTSETTKERALAEKVRDFANDQTLIKSALFKEMKKVLKWLEEPQTDASTKNLMSINIEALFYSTLPYNIKTADFMFIEQYHTGKLGILHDKKIDDIGDWCHGGYVPVFMVRNTYDFGAD